MTISAERWVVAGSGDDFLLATGLRLAGTQREIGAALAEEVAATFPSIVSDPPDPAVSAARRRWTDLHWPEHARRMLGFADHLGLDPHDGSIDLVDLVGIPVGTGCSAVWCPPASSASGCSLLARNFDFRTGSIFEVMGLDGGTVGTPPMMSRPYVIATAPSDVGLGSVVVAACDFTGCFEGVNEAGLAVVLLADDESSGLRPSWNVQAGVHELQLPRLVLDQCASVAEAIVVLHTLKQYDQSMSAHYLLADRSGAAAVWERETHNAEHVVPLTDGPSVVTNYLLHRHPVVSDLPDDDPQRGDMFDRARRLAARLSRVPLAAADVHSALDAVAITGGPPVARTLWHTSFDLDAATMTVEFHLGNRPDGTARRSAPDTVAAGQATHARLQTPCGDRPKPQ